MTPLASQASQPDSDALVERARRQIDLGKATGAHTGSEFNIYQIAEELLAALSQPSTALSEAVERIDLIQETSLPSGEYDLATFLATKRLITRFLRQALSTGGSRG